MPYDSIAPLYNQPQLIDDVYRRVSGHVTAINVYPTLFNHPEILSREQRQGIEDQRERAHFITLVYLCKVPEDYIIPSEKNEQGQAGALKWFTDLPENLIPIQECYRTNWDNIKKVILED